MSQIVPWFKSTVTAGSFSLMLSIKLYAYQTFCKWAYMPSQEHRPTDHAVSIMLKIILLLGQAQ